MQALEVRLQDNCYFVFTPVVTYFAVKEVEPEGMAWIDWA
jgi:hypothetical protein